MRLAIYVLPAVLLMALAQNGWSGPLFVTGNDINVRVHPAPDATVAMRLGHNRKVIEIDRRGDWIYVEIADAGGRDGWIHSAFLTHRREPRSTPKPEARAPDRGHTTAPLSRRPIPVVPTPEVQPNHAAADMPVETVALETVPQASTTEPQASVTEPQASVMAPRTSVMVELPAAHVPAAAEPKGLRRFRETVDYLNGRALQVAGIDLFTGVEPGGDGVVQVATTAAWSKMPPTGQESYANTLLDHWMTAQGRSRPATVQIIGPTGEMLFERAQP